MNSVIYLINNKKLSYRRDSAGPQSQRRSRLFKIIDFDTNYQLKARMRLAISEQY